MYSNIFPQGYGTIYLDQQGCLQVHISSLQASADSYNKGKWNSVGLQQVVHNQVYQQTTDFHDEGIQC